MELTIKKPAVLVKRLCSFISDTVKACGFSKVVLGLSGGLDSAVVAYLAKKALGSKNVIAVIMPYGKLSSQSVKDAKRIASILSIKAFVIDISPMIKAYFGKVKTQDRLRRGNKMARERMSVLYDLSKAHKALVIGTSNKTERVLGYGTIYGDMACALNPIGNLYKTQVRQVASYLGVPEHIIYKVPSADLWHGQSDEQEIGYRYEDIDDLLSLMERGLADKRLMDKGFKKSFISDIYKRIAKNRFKTSLPIIAEV